MEPKDKFLTVHEDFFGNIVGSIVSTIKTITPSTDFVTDWSLPTPAHP